MESTTNLRDTAAIIDLFDRAVVALNGSPLRDKSIVRIPGRGRLLATGDLHDNPAHLEAIMRLARLEVSTDHHVVLHEMIHGANLINGVDLSHRMLARVAESVLRFPEQVHPLLANHEMSQMTGAGVSKGAGNSVELFDDGLEYVFGDGAAEVAESINGFIRAFPLALKSDSGVLCAHSLPAPAMMDRFDLGVLERELVDSDYRAPHGAAYLMVWGRGHTTEQIESLAQRWGVRLFCLGHQYVETGVEAHADKVVILNSDHDHGRALPIDLARVPGAEEAVISAVPLA